MKNLWRKTEEWWHDSSVAIANLEYSPKLRTAVQTAVMLRMSSSATPQDFLNLTNQNYTFGIITNSELSNRFDVVREKDLSYSKNPLSEVTVTNLTYTNGKITLWYTIDGGYPDLADKKIIVIKKWGWCFIEIQKGIFKKFH